MRNYFIAGITAVICLVFAVVILIPNSKQKMSEQFLKNETIIATCWPFPECVDFPEEEPDDNKFFQSISELEEVGIKPLEQEENG